MECKVTRFELSDTGVATVWLHRPERGNSWTGRMHTELRYRFAAIEHDRRARVVVLTGSGTSFCVGADSKALDGHLERGSYDDGLPDELPQPGYGVAAEFDEDMAWMLGFRLPIIAAVNGACAGIAMALAAFSDLRFAVAGAKVTTAAPRLGLPAEYGLSWMLPRLIGPAHAADLLYTGRIVRTEELGAMGFFNAVLERSEFDAHVARFATMIAAASPIAVQTAKRQVQHDLLHNNPAASVATSKAEIARLMKLPDYAEGVAALLAKREPKF